MQKGKASLLFEHPVYITASASVAGKKEGEGPLASGIDLIEQDPLFGTDTWEQAESAMQKQAADLAIEKGGLLRKDIRYLFAGDLLGQLIATSFGTVDLEIPLFGLYGACSTMGEALSLGTMCVDAGHADHVLAVASSHYASAEKQFRFPLAYGNQRPECATWTVTGCGAVVLSRGKCGSSGVEKASSGREAALPVGQEATPAGQAATPAGQAATPAGQAVTPAGQAAAAGRETTAAQTGSAPPHTCVRVTGITTGRVVDLGTRDSMNMGSSMAPAAWDTIRQNFADLGVDETYYDQIITGDLGEVGRKILFDFMKQDGVDIRDRHTDCGLEIYDNQAQDTHSGGSGCGCAAVTLCAHILPKLLDGTWKRVLFVPTGALLSKVSFNEGQSIPAIAHAVILEREVSGAPVPEKENGGDQSK